jgi:ferritin-like metal-binding protein YciE
MKMGSVQDLMITGLTYTLDFENQIAKTAPTMAQASSNPELKQAFEKTEAKSKEYAQRIEQTFQKLGQQVHTNENSIAKAMIQEVQNMISNTDPGPVRDAALIVAANQQQHYRVANYGSLATYADLLGKGDAVSGLKQSLDDSKGGDAKFTSIGEETVNQEAAHAVAA